MAITVVISQMVKYQGDKFFVKGTVGGNAFTAIWKQKFLNVADANTPAAVAEWFGNLYQQIIDVANAEIVSRTVQSRMSDNRVISNVYSVIGTCLAFVGYDMLEITATCDGVASTKALISYDDFLTYAFASGAGKVTIQDRLAQLLYDSKQNKLNTLAGFYATFAAVTTTSSETTTSTTTTTTTT